MFTQIQRAKRERVSGYRVMLKMLIIDAAQHIDSPESDGKIAPLLRSLAEALAACDAILLSEARGESGNG